MTFRNRIVVLMTALMGVVGLFATTAGIASASTTTESHSLYGQCGPAVHNGSQLIDAWGAMNVLNSSSARSIVQQAGWNATDGSMVSFVVQRGRQFQLATPANVVDYGCQVGNMFSVGTRHYGAGEWVIGIVPDQYSPANVSSTPRAGYAKKLVWVHTVGRGSCANGFRGRVLVVMYVKVPAKAKPVVKPKPKPKPAPKKVAPKPKPKVVPASPVAVAVCLNHPEFGTTKVPSGWNRDTNGNCTAVAVTVSTNQCNGSTATYTNTDGTVINCITNTNTNTNTNPVTVTVNPIVIVNPAPPVVITCASLGLNGTYPACVAPVSLVLSNLTNTQNSAGGIAPDGEGNIPFCVSAVDTRAGDNIKLVFAASTGFGSFASGGIVQFTSTGADTKCGIYTAPNDTADVGKTETITVSGIDTTAGVTGTPPTPWSFTFQTPPGNHPG